MQTTIELMLIFRDMTPEEVQIQFQHALGKVLERDLPEKGHGMLYTITGNRAGYIRVRTEATKEELQ